MILDHPVVPLLGRLMMAYIFATSGIGKIFGWSGNVAYMSTRHLPMIPVLLAIERLRVVDRRTEESACRHQNHFLRG